MYKIAIVEDETDSFTKLQDYILKYGEEYNISFNVVKFNGGINFLDSYKNDFDIVFMDVDMPHMNGFEVAAEMRKIDKSTILIFVTFLAKYAIRGYEYDAQDYILKPYTYESIKVKLEKAINNVERNKKVEIVLPLKEGELKTTISSIDYIEVSDHDVCYHVNGQVFTFYGNMKMIESKLPKNEFSRCNRCYLVNLRNVSRIEGNFAIVGNDKLLISRPRKKPFLDSLHNYLSKE